jgi:ribosomal protein S18 acetylase RimI-like enzyme
MAAAESGFESIRQVTVGDIPGAAATLAEAFVDDPIKCYLVGRDHVPASTSVPFFKAFLRMQVPHGLTWMTRGFESVSVWAPPDHWKVPTLAIARNMPTFLWLYRTRILQNLLVLNDMERRHPKEPHYYLEFVGTTPAAQGQGMGSKVIAPMCQRADVEGVGMYLESSKESNLAFYGRFGFEVRDTIRHRNGGPTMWLMWRDPR